MAEHEYKSRKSRTIFTVSGDAGRAFIAVSGEASCNRGVLAEVVRIRRDGAGWDEAVWIAKQLANRY